MMLNVTAASNPVEISSIHSTRALVTSVSAMVTLFFSPPETPRTRSSPMMVSMHPSSASKSVTARNLSRCSAAPSSVSGGGGHELSCENAAVSRTVRNGRCVSTCSTYAQRRLTETPFCLSSEAVRPPYVTADSGRLPAGKHPANALSSAVLPWPGGASTSVISPGRNAHCTSCRTGNSVMAFLPSSLGAAPTARARALNGATAAPANTSGTVTMSRSTFDAGSDKV
mmetsp:Transcript_7250/g.30900  ORF Transcript_7250/g.30900 Transcript_7250/m.30900 type:complete len:227 (-) Transcript_7250:340-1020(-)